MLKKIIKISSETDRQKMAAVIYLDKWIKVSSSRCNGAPEGSRIIQAMVIGLTSAHSVFQGPAATVSPGNMVHAKILSLI